MARDTKEYIKSLNCSTHTVIFFSGSKTNLNLFVSQIYLVR